MHTRASHSSWASQDGGCAEFGAVLPPAAPLVLSLAFPSALGALAALLDPAAAPALSSFSVPLLASAAPPPLLGNATHSVANYASSLAFQGTAPLLSPAVALPPGVTVASASLVGSTAETAAFTGASFSLMLAQCAPLASLQQGVNCSAESPPAPAPSAATELFVLERRRRRRRSRALLQAPAVSTCRAYYRSITLLSAATIIASPPALPDTASGAVPSPYWSLSVSRCALSHVTVNAPVSQQQWRADVKAAAGGTPAWCADWAAIAKTALAATGTPPPTLALTLRAAADPVVVASDLTHCTMALGVPPADYARRGAVCLLFGGALTALGMLGLWRAAAAEGHALGLAAPMASLRAAYQAVSYGAMDGGSSAAMAGTQAGGWRAGATRQVPAPPPNAAPFDGVTRA
jgi:hypothetical protein